MALQALSTVKREPSRAGSGSSSRAVSLYDPVSGKLTTPTRYSRYESAINDIHYNLSKASEDARKVDQKAIEGLEKIGSVDTVRVVGLFSEVNKYGRLSVTLLRSISDARPAKRGSKKNGTDPSVLALLGGSSSNISTVSTKLASPAAVKPDPSDLSSEADDSILVYAPDIQIKYMDDADKAHALLYKNPEHHDEPGAKHTYLHYRLVQLQQEASRMQDKVALKSHIKLLTQQREFWARIPAEWKPYITLGNVHGAYGPPKPNDNAALQCKSRPGLPDGGIQSIVEAALKDFDVYRDVCYLVYICGSIPKLIAMGLAPRPDGSTVDPFMFSPETRPATPMLPDHPLYKILYESSNEISIKYPSALVLGKTPRDPRLLPDPKKSGLGKACIYRCITIVPPSPFLPGSKVVSKKLGPTRVMAYWMFGDKETYQIIRPASSAAEFRKFMTHPELLTEDMTLLNEEAPVNLLFSPDIVAECLNQSARVEDQVAEAAIKYDITNNPANALDFENAVAHICDSAVHHMVATLAPYSGLRSTVVREVNPQNLEVAKAQREKDRLKRTSYVAHSAADDEEVDANKPVPGGNTAGDESATTAPGSTAASGAAVPAPSTATTEGVKEYLRFQWYGMALHQPGPFALETVRWLYRDPDTGLDSFWLQPAEALTDEIKSRLRPVRTVDLDLGARRAFYRFGIDSDQMSMYGFAPEDHLLPAQLIMIMVSNSVTVQQGVIAAKKQIQKAQNVFHALFPDADPSANAAANFKRDVLMELCKCNKGISNVISSLFNESQIARFVIEMDDAERAQRVDALVTQSIRSAFDFNLTDNFSAIYTHKVFLDLRETVVRAGHEITAETARHLESFIGTTKSICGVGQSMEDKTVILVNSKVTSDGKSNVVGGLIDDATRNPDQGQYRYFIVSTQLYNDREKCYTDVPPDMWNHIFCQDYYNLRDNITVAKYFADKKITEPPTSLSENRLKLRGGLSAPFLLFALAPEKSNNTMIDEQLSDMIVYESLAGTVRRPGVTAGRNRLGSFLQRQVQPASAPAVDSSKIMHVRAVPSVEDESLAAMDIDQPASATTESNSAPRAAPVVQDIGDDETVDDAPDEQQAVKPGLKRTHSEMLAPDTIKVPASVQVEGAAKKKPLTVPGAPKKPANPTPFARPKGGPVSKSKATAAQQAIVNADIPTATAADEDASAAKRPKIE